MGRCAARQVAFAGALVCLLALPPFTPASAQEIFYGYDALGRLIWVQDQTGEVAIYVYDPVGNILQILRGSFPDPSASVGISAFTPSKGAVGTSVTIFGKGFSPTLGDNQVVFNGTAARVTAAAAFQLTAAVPPGATTGPIAVSVGLNTGTSAQPFTVLAALAVVPDRATVLLGQAYRFQATLDGAPAGAVTWRVNGTAGGSASLGTIDATGVYTAPPAPPPVSPLTVEAALTADPSQVARAQVDLLPAGAGGISTARLSVGPPPPPLTANPLATPALSVGPSPPALTANPLPAPLLGVSPVPVITAVSPGSGARGTTVPVTLTGVGLANPTALVALRNDAADPLITVSGLTATPDGTSLSATLTLDPTAPGGGRILQVTAGGGTSTRLGTGGNAFSVQ